MPTDALYDEDFVVWTERQAGELRRLAREGSNLPLDWENLAEEIESLGKRDRRGFHNRIHQILRRLLKIRFSSAEQARRGWRGEVREQRRRLGQVLRDSPSLRPSVRGVIAEEWRAAVERAESDLNEHGEAVSLAHLSAKAPTFSAEEVLGEDWYPEPETEMASGPSR
jgi:hypothetical protein